ncbi:hypothetical protein RHGRI_038196 [Rhododendron griersonianum]|uniref:Uncharacterized protein n=1 Tax=Rhododendron griersonianum TaxID=479676 RepID=A0AAV6HUS2_9ERIC|nr:hypothetical protein RHGRI_038196 [Rhododendron griersonianum]
MADAEAQLEPVNMAAYAEEEEMAADALEEELQPQDFYEWLNDNIHRSSYDVWLQKTDGGVTKIVGMSKTFLKLFNGILDYLNAIHEKGLFDGDLQHNIQIEPEGTGAGLSRVSMVVRFSGIPRGGTEEEAVHFVYKVYEIRKRDTVTFDYFIALDGYYPGANMTGWTSQIPVDLRFANTSEDQLPLRKLLYDRRQDSVQRRGGIFYQERYRNASGVPIYMRVVGEHGRDDNPGESNGKLMKELLRALPDALPKLHYVLCFVFRYEGDAEGEFGDSLPNLLRLSQIFYSHSWFTKAAQYLVNSNIKVTVESQVVRRQTSCSWVCITDCLVVCLVELDSLGVRWFDDDDGVGAMWFIINGKNQGLFKVMVVWQLRDCGNGSGKRLQDVFAAFGYIFRNLLTGKKLSNSYSALFFLEYVSQDISVLGAVSRGIFTACLLEDAVAVVLAIQELMNQKTVV